MRMRRKRRGGPILKQETIEEYVARGKKITVCASAGTAEFHALMVEQSEKRAKEAADEKERRNPKKVLPKQPQQAKRA